jgi:iron complex outermembrane receptor protein
VLIFSVPTDAIERVEILRDGASAQYGSDDCRSYEYHFKESTNGGSVTLKWCNF